MLPRWKDNKPGELPEVPSVTSIWAAAEWHEREVYDLTGVHFTGHPELTRILLADTPGPTCPNMRRLVFQRVQRPLFPLDDVQRPPTGRTSRMESPP